MTSTISLSQLGWQPFFQQQLSLAEFEQTSVGRVVAHHRSEYLVQTEQQRFALPVTASLPLLTLGDWLLFDHQMQPLRLLERKTLLRRKAAGTKVSEQYLAANVDTLFIVCSLNLDFNLNRIERYLALVHEAGAEPVVVLTKQDLCAQAEEKRDAVQRLDPMVAVVTVNALDPLSCEPLLRWCREGRTLSLLGSSGVGKSTLLNTLMGQQVQPTAAIREDDSKGRHTTTARSMHLMPSGGVLIDTPGMRELQLVDCEQGLSRVFADIDALAKQCRFRDCQHGSEPGCAVRHALETGQLDGRHLANYFKLLKEQSRNSASLQELRAKDRAFGKMVRSVLTGHKYRD